MLVVSVTAEPANVVAFSASTERYLLRRQVHLAPWGLSPGVSAAVSTWRHDSLLLDPEFDLAKSECRRVADDPFAIDAADSQPNGLTGRQTFHIDPSRSWSPSSDICARYSRLRPSLVRSGGNSELALTSVGVARVRPRGSLQFGSRSDSVTWQQGSIPGSPEANPTIKLKMTVRRTAFPEPRFGRTTSSRRCHPTGCPGLSSKLRWIARQGRIEFG